MRIRLLTPLLMILLIFAPYTLAQAQTQKDERSVKAAYIYNFLHFTEWPTPPNQPFHFCIVGHTSLDRELARLNHKPIRDGVVIAISHVSVTDDWGFCRALFVDSSSRKQIDRLLVKLNSAPILTISDSKGLADHGIMIEMGARHNRIAFDINLKAAHAANMNFSARLLKLARYVAMR
ncbi:YfiR family protein [Amphritea pacifica]|uniref:YfiR family protein n=1 Tax=Amphritea pacifica TaxID=2811233 RepID=UPI001962715B|nr:YfiR family protein [Amphritea pacifica]MBN1007644.1 YfiR family protein [Amphritea pacifica]